MVLSYFSSKTTKDKDFFELKPSLDLTLKNTKKIVGNIFKNSQERVALGYLTFPQKPLKLFEFGFN